MLNSSFMLVLIAVLCICARYTLAALYDSDGPIFRTIVTSQDVKTGEVTTTNQTYDMPYNPPAYRGSYIDVVVVDKPHNLFIGRCLNNEEELHREVIVINNDGRSHVTGLIRLNVDKPGSVEIACVNVYDEQPGAGAYPSYVGGGVGYNYVEIGVATQFGKGFAIFVQIFGRVLDQH